MLAKENKADVFALALFSLRFSFFVLRSSLSLPRPRAFAVTLGGSRGARSDTDTVDRGIFYRLLGSGGFGAVR